MGANRRIAMHTRTWETAPKWLRTAFYTVLAAVWAAS